jgi:hypothetical protein
MKKTNKTQIRWDDKMVIAVMVVSALCILILLANYISVTGEAASNIPTFSGFTNMLNGAVVVQGNGETRCTIECSQLGEVCILARSTEGIVKCSKIIEGNYNCLCTTTDKIIGEIPK